MRIDGNKTYITAALIVLYAILGLVLGYHTIDKAIELLLAAGALVGVRSAIRKIE